jgi:hypothetical protein
VFRLLPLAQMRRQKPAGIVCVLCRVATNAIILDIVESLGIRCFHKNLRRKAAKEKLDPFDMMIVQVEPFAPLA